MRSLRLKNRTDGQLLELMQQQDEGAYYELFDRYWEKLYSMARRMIGDADISKDVVQDVFLSFWERRSEIRNENVGAYFAQATRFRVYKQLRDGRISQEYEAFIEQLPDLSAGIELEHVQLQATLEMHIQALPERCREVFRLSRIEHMSNKEIAEKLELSQRTVETHISNALKFLRKRLKHEHLLLLMTALNC